MLHTLTEQHNYQPWNTNKCSRELTTQKINFCVKHFSAVNSKRVFTSEHRPMVISLWTTASEIWGEMPLRLNFAAATDVVPLMQTRFLMPRQNSQPNLQTNDDVKHCPSRHPARRQSGSILWLGTQTINYFFSNLTYFTSFRLSKISSYNHLDTTVAAVSDFTASGITVNNCFAAVQAV